MDVFGSKKELNLKALPPSMTPTITSDADEVTGPWLFPQRGFNPKKSHERVVWSLFIRLLSTETTESLPAAR
jgi:hypothetical protein